MDSLALLLADSRLPVGGHTQSGGLEPALLAGMAPDRIEEFLVTRLRTAVSLDAATAVVTTRHPVLQEVVDAWNARVPSEVVRAASCRAARGYLRLGTRVGLDPVLARRTDLPRPVALGLLGRHWGLSAEQVARVCCHDEIQSVTAAALKLVPLDPLDTVDWVLRLGPEVEALVTRVAELTEPDLIPAATAVHLELWQHDHPLHTRRLFHA